MTFHTYNSNIYTMIDEIVNQLVAEDSTHYTKVTTGNTAKAAFHYTGAGEDKYVMLYAWRSTTAQIYHASTAYNTYIVEIVIGTAWDDTNKTPITSTARYYAPLYFLSTAGMETTIFSTRTHAHKLWVDTNGFYWLCGNTYTDNYATGFLMCVEFLPTAGKLYNDGASGIFVMNLLANDQNAVSNNITSSYFASNGNGYASYAITTAIAKNGQFGVVQSDFPMFDYLYTGRALRNTGDSKVYFDFLKFYKSGSQTSGVPPAYNNPITMTKRLILCQKNGLAANDIIGWVDGATTRKYIVCDVCSALGTLFDYIAIPYENAVTYSLTV